MLQIVTGMYFRDVPLRETKHRGVFYSNATMLQADDVELPIGRFLFTSSIAPVEPVTIEAIERLGPKGPTADPRSWFRPEVRSFSATWQPSSPSP